MVLGQSMGAAVSEEPIGMAEVSLAPEAPVSDTPPESSIQAAAEVASEPESLAETAGPTSDEASSEGSGQ